MKKQYHFTYDLFEGDAIFVIDTEVFTEEVARESLEFYYRPHVNLTGNVIIDTLRMYAEYAIKEASFDNASLYGVKLMFSEAEGLYSVDGTQGIELTMVNGLEFDEDLLELKDVKDV